MPIRNINIDSILSTLKDKVVGLAKTTFTDFKNEAAKDARKLLTTITEDLKRRTTLLAENKITLEEFKVLILADEDLVAMNALTQAGLAAAKIDAFKQSLFKIIIDTIIALI